MPDQRHIFATQAGIQAVTDEERTVIASFIARIGGAAPQAGTPGETPAGVPGGVPGGMPGGISGGISGSVPLSVPATRPALPPIDPDADRLIAELFQRYPEARYRLTQMAFVQEHALAAANARIAQLQLALRQATQATQAGGAGPAAPGIFQSVFGGAAAAPAPVPPQPYRAYPAQPPYPPQSPYPAQSYVPPSPGGNVPQSMVQRGGSGFLGSALSTAAGVAGGMIAGNALMDLFSPHHAEAAMPLPDANPWGGAVPGAGASAWDNLTETSQPAGWDQAADQGWDNAGTGWDDAGTDGGTDGSSDGGSDSF